MSRSRPRNHALDALGVKSGQTLLVHGGGSMTLAQLLGEVGGLVAKTGRRFTLRAK